jgi:hypothetical protein
MYVTCEVDAMKNIVMDQHTNILTPSDKKTLPQPSTTNDSGPENTQGLKIDNTLFCLDTGKIKYLFATEEEAIEQLRKLDKNQINPDNSQIVQVNTTGNMWKLTQIPWSRIAIKLL